MVKVVVVNGKPGVGKSEFERMCKEQCGLFNRVPGFEPGKDLWIDITSTVDFVKEVATMCGWDGSKTLENRKFLSDLKDLLSKWDDVPFKTIVHRANTLPDNTDWIMFVDCREPSEIQKLKEGLNATTVLIRRPGDEEMETSNHADAGVFEYEYDLNIYNEYGLDELEMMAKNFIEYMKKDEVPHYVNVD
jgi:hypothetical protein